MADKREPTVVFATVRDGGEELHIECRMSDDQKGAFIRVNPEFERLAFLIAGFLNFWSQYWSQYK